MQLCPLFTSRPFTHISAAFAISASSSIMYASLPPSSSTCFFKCLPAAPATCLPAAVLPVSVTAAMASLPISSSIRELGSISVWNIPLGAPAFFITCSMASAQAHTLLACFSTITLPAISAGPIARNTCQ